MKSILPRIVALAALGLAFALPVRAAESPSVLLQKGIYAEETEGNVDAAIKIYEQIAAEAATNRAIVAQAQYRLALCYQKKGNKEQAIKVLEELVHHTSSDPDVRKRALDTLVQLGASPEQNVTIRKLGTVKPGWFVAGSRDGRLLEYQAFESSAVSVYETATGNIRDIAQGARDDHVYDATFSPDSRRLAYTLNGHEIWVADLSAPNSTKKLLQSNEKPGAVWTLGWIPDSSAVLVARLDGKTNAATVLSIDPANGASKEITRVPNAVRRGGWALSSNGQLLALRKGGSENRKLALVDLETGREETLVESDDPFIVGWAAKDSKFVFATHVSTQSDGLWSKMSNGLWAVSVDQGKPKGRPELILSNLGSINDAFITSDGTVYYSRDQQKGRDWSSSEVWLMEGLLRQIDDARDRAGDLEIEERSAGKRHAVFDRKSGVQIELAEGWRVIGAARQSAAQTRINLAAATCLDAKPALICGIKHKRAASGEIDALMRKFAEETLVAARIGSDNIPDYKNRPDSYHTHKIGELPALDWVADFTVNGDRWTEYLTLLYTEASGVLFRVQAPAGRIESLKADYEQMLATIQLQPVPSTHE